MAFRLLTRDQFRKVRDGHRCCVCGAPATRSDVQLDAHHLIERRLWADGGYYLENGATVCGPCHLKAEQTLISCEELRERCGINRFPLPDHLYPDEVYTKWGDVVLPNGTRVPGELFEDESVQKVLQPVLHLYVDRIKYPRTWHLPWSPGKTKDDRVLADVACFQGREVIVTLKMDGENTSLYRDGLHARSVDYSPHPSRDRIKALHAAMAHDIPEGFRICGENVFAKHSIHYRGLESYFYVFSIWNRSECLSWAETCIWSALFGFPTVPVLYRGPWNERAVRELAQTHFDGNEMEGYVVRVADAFRYRDFRSNVAKYVRSGHVQTSHHWKREAVVPNVLKTVG